MSLKKPKRFAPVTPGGTICIGGVTTKLLVGSTEAEAWELLLNDRQAATNEALTVAKLKTRGYTVQEL